MRDDYDYTGYTYVSTLLNNLQDDGLITVSDITKSTDEYSSYDVTATINGKPYYIECKTRSDDYLYRDFKESGYYLDVKKNNGQNNLYAYIFPNDDVIMLTTPEKLKDLEGKPTKIRRLRYCDKESPEGIRINYIVPYNRFWVWQLHPFIKIDNPIKNK